MASQPAVSFPGIVGIIDASYTLSHGPTPGICSLTIVPQTSAIPEVGTLTFSDGPVRLVFPDMKVDQGRWSIDQQGHVVKLNLFDRRWKWQFGAVSGVYNTVQRKLVQRARETRNIAHGRRNAKQLCTYLLNALGEVAFDVSQVPETVFPEVEWDATGIAQALSEVVDLCGCRIVLKLNNTVQIARSGFGAALPPGAIINGGEGANPAERPSHIQVVCERSLFETPLPLIAVGETEDGGIAPIDNLPYKPAAGWETENTTFFPNVGDTFPGDAARRRTCRELAKKSVFRWFSIYMPFREGAGQNVREYLPIDGYGRIYQLEQILPLMPYRLSDATRNDLLVDNGTEYKEPKIFGQMRQPWRSGTGLHNWNTGDVVALSTRYPAYVKFNIDTERGLVRFEKPMTMASQIVDLPAGGTVVTRWRPAQLYLGIAFGIRDLATWAPHRYTFTAPVPGAPAITQPKVVYYPGIYLQRIRYAGNVDARRGEEAEAQQALAQNVFGMPDGFRGTNYTNEHLLRTELTAAYQAELARYAGNVSAEATYAGFVPVNPDGAIQQCSWSFSQSGAYTRAGRNTEYDFATPAYKLRRSLFRLNNADLTVIRR